MDSSYSTSRKQKLGVAGSLAFSDLAVNPAYVSWSLRSCAFVPECVRLACVEASVLRRGVQCPHVPATLTYTRLEAPLMSLPALLTLLILAARPAIAGSELGLVACNAAGAGAHVVSVRQLPSQWFRSRVSNTHIAPSLR
jgi:hypothetical protein